MKLTFALYRYNPDVDTKPYMKDYTLEVPDGTDMMVLDALIKLKEQDSTLAFRRSCREGVCGSDGVNMNGKNGLACITPLSTFKGKKMEIRPLPGMPVVRDLVVDLTQFYKQYEKIKPYLINDEQAPAREHLQSPEERAHLDGLYELIDSRDTATEERLSDLDDAYSVFRCHGIMNCVDVCPKGLNPTKAIGHIKSMLLKRAV